LSRGPSGRGSTGDFVFAVFDLLADRQYGKEFVSAGHTAKGGNAQGSPERGAEALGVIAGDALDVEVAANRAVGGKDVREGSGAGAEAFGASRTSPGHVSDGAGAIIKERSSARPAAVRRIAERTDHQTCDFTLAELGRSPMLWEIPNPGKQEVAPAGCRKAIPDCATILTRRRHG
jgi:hypothetical protein